MKRAPEGQTLLQFNWLDGSTSYDVIPGPWTPRAKLETHRWCRRRKRAVRVLLLLDETLESDKTTMLVYRQVDCKENGNETNTQNSHDDTL